MGQAVRRAGERKAELGNNPTEEGLKDAAAEAQHRACYISVLKTLQPIQNN